MTLSRPGYNNNVQTSPQSTVTFPTTVPPAVDDATPVVGDVLGVTSGTCNLDGVDVPCDAFTDPVPLYQWFVGGVAVPAAQGGTAATFTVPASAIGKVIAVRVHYRANFYFSSPSMSANTAAVVGMPIVAGTLHPTVTLDPGTHTSTVTMAGTSTTPGPFTYTYMWYREGVATPISITSGYTLVSADTGKSVTVVVTLAKSGFTSLTLAPVLANGISQTQVAVITGGTSYGDVLTCDAPPYSLASTDLVVSGSNGTITYQWFRGADAISASPISGETLSQYTVDPLDENTNLYCDVTVAAPLHATLVERTAPHLIPS
jgi:hypothetical protein